MKKPPRFVAGLAFGLSFGPLSAQTVFVREDPVILDLAAEELIGTVGNVQAVDLGSESLLVSGNVVSTSLNVDSTPVNDTVSKFVGDEIVRVQFRNDVVSCGGSVSVSGLVQDELGNPGRVSSVGNPASFVFMTFTPVEIGRRCRGNGSLLRVQFGGNFDISGIANSSSSGAYTGTLTINIAFP